MGANFAPIYTSQKLASPRQHNMLPYTTRSVDVWRSFLTFWPGERSTRAPPPHLVAGRNQLQWQPSEEEGDMIELGTGDLYTLQGLLTKATG
ncbi:unnamed protein product [Protopolystoma xenopodis]|uniref:Uncharacterized protein n=1 Tax=Protopolystoma xenopodis TaxID=117903 RepID=A0A3S5CCI7_9PLAT|nr:unnamed protein product [Protopolystoma xenopodis]